ncbi:5691_t:CDS:2 [Ambispora gerdemannii]|uniref:5691_t:CDS:1 n=1 Tax=Ambispora gerdemannii TaxID=144530 RepID=A0A9N9F3L9_9GLOM|nr:5691_t:CDS:2 [Ambispora gerdemannii]
MALFVGRLALDTHPRDLEHIFDKYGRLNRLEIKRGYAFVEYMDTRDASDALKETDGMRVRGNRIVVEWAKNGGKKPGMSAYGKAGPIINASSVDEKVIGRKIVVQILFDLIIDIVAGALEKVWPLEQFQFQKHRYPSIDSLAFALIVPLRINARPFLIRRPVSRSPSRSRSPRRSPRRSPGRHDRDRGGRDEREERDERDGRDSRGSGGGEREERGSYSERRHTGEEKRFS